MQCQKCGSRLISWELDSGKVITEYNEQGEQISMHCEIDSIVSPQCNECGSTDIK